MYRHFSLQPSCFIFFRNSMRHAIGTPGPRYATQARSAYEPTILSDDLSFRSIAFRDAIGDLGLARAAVAVVA